MEQYLKLFRTNSEYEVLTDKPPVSHIVEDVDIKMKSPNNIITYWASEKMPEVTVDYQSGLHKNMFNVSISAHTFNNGVGKIIFYGDVTRIGDYAFHCSNNNSFAPTRIEIPDTVTTLGTGAFSGTKLISMNLSDKITTVGGVIFSYCMELVNAKLPSGMTTLGDSFFATCRKLESVTIPNGVTTIGNMTFMDCDALTTVEIPSGVTEIGFNAFYNLPSLTSIICRPITPPTLGSNSMFTNTNNCPIYVPADSVNAYKTANIWRNVSSRIRAIE